MAPWLVTGTWPVLRKVATGTSWLFPRVVATEVPSCPHVGGAGHLLTTKGHYWGAFFFLSGAALQSGYLPKFQRIKPDD